MNEVLKDKRLIFPLPPPSSSFFSIIHAVLWADSIVSLAYYIELNHIAMLNLDASLTEHKEISKTDMNSFAKAFYIINRLHSQNWKGEFNWFYSFKYRSS